MKNTLKKIVVKIKKYFWVFLIIIAVLGVRWFYTRDGIRQVSVRIVEPQKRVVEKTVSTSGIVKSSTEADLSFNATGRIIDILVEEGDQVNKGQLLAYIDNGTITQTAQSYRDARDIAKRNKEIFVEQYDKNRERIGGEADYQLNLRKYDELISQAEANYNAQISTLNKYYIYAPTSGVVVDIKKEVGENVTLNETIISINNLADTLFEVEVDQEDYGLLALDQDVNIDLDAYTDTQIKGKVSKLPLFVNQAANSRFLVEVQILNGDENIKPLVGMTGDARIIVSNTNEEVDSLFYDEIFFDEEDNPYVFIEENGLIKEQPISIGLEGDIYTEIIKDFDNNIVNGVNDDIELEAGLKAKIVDL